MISCAATNSPCQFNLHKMTNKGLSYDGAVCLDGSDAAFYIHRGSNAKTNSWLMFLSGGDVCESVELCTTRALSHLGSNRDWPATMDMSDQGGPLSLDCYHNPDFCEFNIVIAQYCDGFSFAGEQASPAVATPGHGLTSIYFRGRRILQAMLDTFVSDYGFASATEFVLMGGSAGAMASMFSADWVHDKVKALAPNLLKYRVVPFSGYFISDPTIEGIPHLGQRIEAAYNLHGATTGVDADCAATESLPWRCGMSEINYHYIDSPIFLHNAVADGYATRVNYLTGTVAGITWPGWAQWPAWVSCALYLDQCTNDQTVILNTYQDRTMELLRAAPTYSKVGNGAFLHSCWNLHGEAKNNTLWNTIAVPQKDNKYIKTMQEATSLWWNSDGTDPAADHTYEPCKWNTEGAPRNCNPTCIGGDYPSLSPPPPAADAGGDAGVAIGVSLGIVALLALVCYLVLLFQQGRQASQNNSRFEGRQACRDTESAAVATPAGVADEALTGAARERGVVRCERV